MSPFQYAATSKKQTYKNAFVEKVQEMFHFAERRVCQGYAGNGPERG
jgi:hypothetical protein